MQVMFDLETLGQPSTKHNALSDAEAQALSLIATRSEFLKRLK